MSEKKPHIIREYQYVKIKDLKLWQIFQPSFDCFTHSHDVRREYLIELNENYAVSQVISKYQGKWEFNIKTRWDDMNAMVYLLSGEHVSEW